ncbi:MAG: phosphoglycerate kinase [Deltaproteobacteria bacterium]|nr:phosphoglycerate kinase [Deltaproteobacteria bacterium]
MLENIRRLDDLPVEGRRVFCRLDLNVPLRDGKVGDETRIRAALPTIRYLIDMGARVVVASHLGRPKGKVVESLTLEPVAAILAELLDQDVAFIPETVGDTATKVVSDLRSGGIAVLENLRFNVGETKNDADFSKQLAALADVYVNDAFGTAHRAHASTVGMVSLVADRGAGRLMFKELEFFGRLLQEPERPFVAVLGGAKVSDKIGVLKSLLNRVDRLLIGGAMANTFLAAKGAAMGASLVERDKLVVARELLAAAEARDVGILLPQDLVVGADPDAVSGRTVAWDEVPGDAMALDIGPATVDAFGAVVTGARTLFWNGPMGVFENDAFAVGTTEIARLVADSDALSVVGGGDSVAAINKAQVADRISHISTGGGASLEMMEGKTLPGVAALMDQI